MAQETFTDERLQNICRIGQGHACCRYLLAGSKGFECGKHSVFKSLLDKRVANEEMVARGDNCEGLISIENAN
jgi:predicted AAA+ superfamily ATPase